MSDWPASRSHRLAAWFNGSRFTSDSGLGPGNGLFVASISLRTATSGRNHRTIVRGLMVYKVIASREPIRSDVCAGQRLQPRLQHVPVFGQPAQQLNEDSD